MGEGVDPTEMCRSLVDKVAQSKQLRAIADPELLALFEDWLEELEAELIRRLQSDKSQGEKEIAERLGLSRRGAHFLLSKLKREGRITTR
jgi:DNA-binding NtrC family response regulator